MEGQEEVGEMKRQINIEALLAPLAGENQAGEDLRYTTVHEAIKEARRSEDAIAMGDWQREVKRADWDKVISLAVEALTDKSKDLQIAAWLTEALTITGGFAGLSCGLKVMSGLLDRFWDIAYPLIDDGDLEYRAAPFEFLNEKLSVCVRQIAVTDPQATYGYSWLKWKESRDVGAEADTRNRFGDVDEQKKQRRDELIAEGKLTAELFDAAVAGTGAAFSQALFGDVAGVLERFEELDGMVDEKFGNEAPTLSDLRGAVDDCLQLVKRIYPGLKESSADTASAVAGSAPVTGVEAAPVAGPAADAMPAAAMARLDDAVGQPAASIPPAPVAAVAAAAVSPVELDEQSRWHEALRMLEGGRFKDALDSLLSAAHKAPSPRERNRFRLFTVKLCLKAGRTDVARPIVEELSACIEELQLERWESPLWIAEVLEAYYQCLQGEDPSDDDLTKSRELFRRICTLDVTKAIAYRIN